MKYNTYPILSARKLYNPENMFLLCCKMLCCVYMDIGNAIENVNNELSEFGSYVLQYIPSVFKLSKAYSLINVTRV